MPSEFENTLKHSPFFFGRESRPKNSTNLDSKLATLKLGLHWVSYKLIYPLLLFSTFSLYHSTHAVGEFRVIGVGAGPAGPVLAGLLLW